MVVHKRKKNKRMRGAKSTHGFGAKKKHRGSGNRGGVGMAGTGKRADQKKPTIINMYGMDYYGKKGFKRPQEAQIHQKTITLEYLDQHLDHYVKQGLVTKEGDNYNVDLEKVGYDRLLGKGMVHHKLTFNGQASEKVAEKIKRAGGSILNVNPK